MDVCPICNHPVEATVVEERRLLVQVQAGPNALPATGRYLTVRILRCECGERIERRYENRELATVEAGALPARA
jgi:hypothetical protein